MAIKDIFKMIKADRYTQDGREELIKAQEAVTEDVTYKPGDISRKTGLQKQPDGSWAPVKNAPANKKPDGKSGSSEKHAKAIEHAKKVGIVTEVPSGWKKAEGVTTTPNGYVAITNGASLFPKEGEAKREIKFIKQEDFDKSASGSAPSASGSASTKTSKIDNHADLLKKAEKIYVDAEGKYSDLNLSREERLKARDREQDSYKLRELLEFGVDKNGVPKNEETATKIQELMQSLGLNESQDSAPRILTGDCKIRIKKA